jgi:hypothetical protein
MGLKKDDLRGIYLRPLARSIRFIFDAVFLRDARGTSYFSHAFSRLDCCVRGIIKTPAFD